MLRLRFARRADRERDLDLERDRDLRVGMFFLLLSTNKLLPTRCPLFLKPTTTTIWRTLMRCAARRVIMNSTVLIADLHSSVNGVIAVTAISPPDTDLLEIVYASLTRRSKLLKELMQWHAQQYQLLVW